MVMTEMWLSSLDLYSRNPWPSSIANNYDKISLTFFFFKSAHAIKISTTHLGSLLKYEYQKASLF